jgi:hypothetical protein
VNDDLSDFGILCSFDFIEKKSKDAFKNYVEVKAKEYALREIKGKQAKHSKMENIKCSNIKMQTYLTSERINPGQKRTIFRFRTTEQAALQELKVKRDMKEIYKDEIGHKKAKT